MKSNEILNLDMKDKENVKMLKRILKKYKNYDKLKGLNVAKAVEELNKIFAKQKIELVNLKDYSKMEKMLLIDYKKEKKEEIIAYSIIECYWKALAYLLLKKNGRE